MARLWAFMMSLMSPVRRGRTRSWDQQGIAAAAAVPLTFMVGPPEAGAGAAHVDTRLRGLP